MSSTTATAIPTYFELSWAVLSTIGLCNVLIGFVVASVTGGFSLILLVPLIVSAGCALGNGLCYIAYIADYPVDSKAAAATFAALGWLIQEGGLPLYGYLILVPILRSYKRWIFQAVFWVLTIVTVVLRGVVVSLEMRYTFKKDISLDWYKTIDRHLCMTSFVTIAVAECMTGVLLLREFHSALRSSVVGPMSGRKLFHYLMCSTEIRVSTLALIGVMRVITFSYHEIGTGNADGVANQLDMLAISLQAMFPVVMFVDILASRLVSARENSIRNHNFGDAMSVHHCTITETKMVASDSGDVMYRRRDQQDDSVSQYMQRRLP